MGYSFIIEDYLKEAVLNKNIEAIKKVAVIIGENTEKTEMLLREKEDIRGDIKVILTEIKSLNENMNKRFEAVDKRFEAMDKRFEEMIKYVDKRFEDMIKYVDKRFEDMNRRFDMMFKFMSLGFGVVTILITVFKFVK